MNTKTKAKVKTDKELATKMGTAKIAAAKHVSDIKAKKQKQDAAMVNAVAVSLNGPDDVTLEYSSPFLEGMENEGAKKRRYHVSDEQINFIMTNANSADYAVVLSSLGRDLGNMQWKLALHCTIVAFRLQRDGQDAIELANAFLKALKPLGDTYTMVRTNEVIAWLENYACVKYTKLTEGYGFELDAKKRSKEAGAFGRSDKGKRDYIITRMRNPFWTFKPEQSKIEFDLHAFLIERMSNTIKQAYKTIKKYKENPDMFTKFEGSESDALLKSLENALKRSDAKPEVKEAITTEKQKATEAEKESVAA